MVVIIIIIIIIIITINIIIISFIHLFIYFENDRKRILEWLTCWGGGRYRVCRDRRRRHEKHGVDCSNNSKVKTSNHFHKQSCIFNV